MKLSEMLKDTLPLQAGETEEQFVARVSRLEKREYEARAAGKGGYGHTGLITEPCSPYRARHILREEKSRLSDRAPKETNED